MADTEFSTIKTYIDNNCNTNGTNDITGAELNTALNYILDGLGGKLFEATKPYKAGQVVMYNDATFGNELWVADSDLSAGAWNASNFTRVTRRCRKITASEAPYTGIDIGSNAYDHDIGHTDVYTFAQTAAGAHIPVKVTGINSTRVTIESSVQYASAVIYVMELVIS